MGFIEKLEEIRENYLTTGMASAAPAVPSQTPSNSPQQTQRPTPQQKKPLNNSQQGQQQSMLDQLLIRAANSEDGMDGLDEFDEYINSLGLDRKRLSGSFGELSKRFLA